MRPTNLHKGDILNYKELKQWVVCYLSNNFCENIVFMSCRLKSIFFCFCGAVDTFCFSSLSLMLVHD